MKRVFSFIVLVTLGTLSLFAASNVNKKAEKQMKADMETVKTNIKSGKDLDKMEMLVRKHLGDSLFSDNMNLRALLADVIKKQYEDGNEKMYLRSSVDTARLIHTGRKMFVACQQLDSIDARPNEKGLSVLTYRKRNADYLAPYRKNIFKGGLYFFNHQKWSEAYDMLDTYIDCRKQPLFSSTPLDSLSDNYAAYVALVAASNMHDFEKARKYETEALRYEPAREISLIILAEMARLNNNQEKFKDYLQMGFEQNPKSSYFFPYLIDYYSNRDDYESAMYYTDKALQTDSLNEIFLLAKHSTLMSMKEYDKSLEYGIKVLNVNDTISKANYNVGYIYYQKAQNAMKISGVPYRQRTRNAQKYYLLCKPYMEKYRKACPDDKERWRPVLYDVYLNLNLGKEFQELDK
ncbi:MAG: hypothetical protein KBT34_04090 [Prevotella sp.]|nr:hypothetical protein [Candidatus Prevotella equi]